MPELADLCVAIVDCEHKTAPKADEGFPLVRTTDIGRGRLDLSNVQRVDPETYDAWTRRLVPQPGDLILAREAPVGNVAVVTPGLQPVLGQRTVLIRPNTDVVDPDFLTYRLLSHDIQHWMDGVANGSTVPHLNMEDIRALPLPPLPEIDRQRVTGRALAAVGDLLENNRRRIEILEEMARLIYREWFVNFRFPGHEDVELVDSALGPIPAGWEVERLNRLVTTQYGYTESASDIPVGPRYLRGMDMNKTSFINWSDVPYCPISDKDHDKFRVDVGDVFVIRMADPGKVGICEREVDAVFASYLVRVKPVDERLDSYFLFYTLSDDRYQGWVTGASTGATRKSVSAKVMTEPAVVLPPIDLQHQFVSTIRPMRELLTNLLEQNRVLAEARDLLLPRLISGELDVSDLDLDLPDLDLLDSAGIEAVKVG